MGMEGMVGMKMKESPFRFTTRIFDLSPSIPTIPTISPSPFVGSL
jgi:hypothetical protein